MKLSPFYLGCAVWAYKEWLGTLFPPGSRSRDFLSLYSRRLTTVEGNTTFYAVPGPEVVARWAEETPENFQFCLKLPRDVSHAGPLAQHLEETRAFVACMEPLGPRLGPFFLQLPPGYGPQQIDDLERWLAAWPRGRRLAVEVRHPDWYADPGEARLQELLARFGVGRVLMDVRPLNLGPLPGAEQDLQRARDNKPDVPMHPLRSADFTLIRYIGHPDLPLNQGLLAEWAERSAAWLREGTTVYAFMHCPIEARSPLICRAFQQQLERLAPVPPLPWGQDDAPVQESMF